jgi:hypothetical protein
MPPHHENCFKNVSALLASCLIAAVSADVAPASSAAGFSEA